MENNNEINLKSKTMSGVFWKFAERFGAQIVTLIVSIVLARILLPEDYGIISIVTILITLCNVFVTHGFGAALIQKNTSDHLDFSSVFYSSIFISLLLYVVLFFTAKPISIFYGNEILCPVIRVMGLRLPIAAINSVQQAYVAKTLDFKKFFFATLIGTIISGGVGLILAYKGFGVWALVAQYLTNVLIDTLVLFITIKWHPLWEFSFKRVKRLLSFGWKLLVSGLIDTGYNELRSLIIGKMYSTEDLAYYDKGKQFPSLIATNVNAALSSVLFATMSKVNDDISKVKNITRKSISLGSYLIMPCMVGLACVAEPFIRIVLTDKWLPAVPYLQIMCFVYAFWPLHTANLEAIKAIGRSDLYLVLEIIKKLVGLAILFATLWFGVFWIAVGMAISTLVGFFINAYPNRKLLKYSYLEQILDITPAILISFVMGICVYLIGRLQLNLYLLIILQITIGILVFILLSVITKNKSFKYILEFVSKNKKIDKKEDFKMKKLMVLGGSRYALPIIEEAHKLNIYVITCDYLPDNIAHKYSDKYVNVSIIDQDAVLKKARELNIDGIVSFACDPGVVTAAYVAEKMGLPSVGSYEAVSILQNKGKFRKFLADNGFNVPMAKSYKSKEDFLIDKDLFHWPVIFKPTDSAGSKGVSRVDSLSQVDDAVKFALDNGHNDEFIVEDFLEQVGCSSDCDSFSIDGKIVFYGFDAQRFDKNAENPYTPAAYTWPSTISSRHLDELKHEIQRVITLLDLKTSVYNIEVRECVDGKAYIMELSPRGGGNRLSEMVKICTGVDMISNAVKFAVGLPVDEIKQEPLQFKLAEIILHSEVKGTFIELWINESLKDNIIERDLWIEKGTRVGGFKGANEAIGTLVLKFENEKLMEEVIQNQDKYIKVIVE